MKNRKVVKSFNYNGLGFSIILENVSCRKVKGQWVPQIDVEVVADEVFKMLPSKPSKLTGNEIKFIRLYLDKSKPAFGELFKVSHTAVSKWEKANDYAAPISPTQEIVMRLFLEDYLNVSNRKFYKTYKGLESAVYEEEGVPLRVAL